MKNIDLLILGEQIKTKKEELNLLTGVIFTYKLSNNILIIENEIKRIQESSKPNDDFTKYDEARVELCKEFAKKDENGEFLYKVHPESGQQEYDIDTESKTWIKAIKKLREENADIISTRESQLKKYNALLQADCNIVFDKISFANIPDYINLEQMLIIKNFIVN